MIGKHQISISIVSHGHGLMVSKLLGDLSRFEEYDLQVILTLNLNEKIEFKKHPGFELSIIKNKEPKGFSANHNSAFKIAKYKYFLVLNPDIRMVDCDFAKLIAVLNLKTVGVVGPRVMSPDGEIQDNARKFPSIPLIIKRKFSSNNLLRDYDISGEGPISVDWLAGMFLLFRSEVFKQVGGFDEQYFLYCEDIDIGRKLRNLGKHSMLFSACTVLHDAQRESRKFSKALFIHASSFIKYFKKWGITNSPNRH